MPNYKKTTFTTSNIQLDKEIVGNFAKNFSFKAETKPLLFTSYGKYNTKPFKELLLIIRDFENSNLQYADSKNDLDFCQYENLEELETQILKTTTTLGLGIKSLLSLISKDYLRKFLTDIEACNLYTKKSDETLVAQIKQLFYKAFTIYKSSLEKQQEAKEILDKIKNNPDESPAEMQTIKPTKTEVSNFLDDDFNLVTTKEVESFETLVNIYEGKYYTKNALLSILANAFNTDLQQFEYLNGTANCQQIYLKNIYDQQFSNSLYLQTLKELEVENKAEKLAEETQKLKEIIDYVNEKINFGNKQISDFEKLLKKAIDSSYNIAVAKDQPKNIKRLYDIIKTIESL